MKSIITGQSTIKLLLKALKHLHLKNNLDICEYLPDILPNGIGYRELRHVSFLATLHDTGTPYFTYNLYAESNNETTPYAEPSIFSYNELTDYEKETLYEVLNKLI